MSIIPCQAGAPLTANHWMVISKGAKNRGHSKAPLDKRDWRTGTSITGWTITGRTFGSRHHTTIDIPLMSSCAPIEGVWLFSWRESPCPEWGEVAEQSMLLSSEKSGHFKATFFNTNTKKGKKKKGKKVKSFFSYSPEGPCFTLRFACTTLSDSTKLAWFLENFCQRLDLKSRHARRKRFSSLRNLSF